MVHSAAIPPFVGSWETSPAYWMYDIVWVVLADGDQTGGAFSVIEQRMRGGSGALVPHVHNFNDEWFHVLGGTMDMTVGGKSIAAKPGDSLWVPRGTVHSFKVTSDECHVMNGYTPAGFEQIIKSLARPAERRELPPSDLPKPDERTLRLIFNNYWTCEAEAGWEQTTADPR